MSSRILQILDLAEMLSFDISLLSVFPTTWELDLEACSDSGSIFWQVSFIGDAENFLI